MRWLRYFIGVAALGVMLYLFWPLIGDLRAAADLFKSAHWIWLPLAILVQLASYACLAWLNALTLQPFSGSIPFSRLMAVLTSIAFIETAIPSAGVSGAALRARLLKKHGDYSIQISMFTLALETLIMLIAITSVSLFGFNYLLRQGEISLARLGELSLAGLAFIGLTCGGLRVIHDQQCSNRIVGTGVALWNRITQRAPGWMKLPLLESEKLETSLISFRASLSQLRRIPWWKFALAAYGRVLLDIGSLGVCFLLFGAPIPANLFTGYGLIILLSGLAGLPGGLGVADISVPVIFARLGVPGATALAAGLTYRLIGFWFLRFIGWINWQVLEARAP